LMNGPPARKRHEAPDEWREYEPARPLPSCAGERPSADDATDAGDSP
jgi:hypothetical protein